MENSFKPQTAFEGWIKRAIDELDEKFNNHLKHHEVLEARLIKWGIALTSISAFIGWLLRGYIK